MSEKKLSPEGELMYRIIEQWGNAAVMHKMEGWIREYGDNRIKAQPGAAWVRASTRLPPLHREVFAKDAKGKKWTVFYTEDGKYDIEIEESEIGELPQDDIAIVTDNGCFLKTGFYEICEQSGGYFDECVYKRDIVEWLDESPAEQPVVDKEDWSNFIPQMSNIQDRTGISIEWQKVWSEVENWYGDPKKKETGEQFLKRIQATYFKAATEQPVREVEFAALLQWVNNEGWKPQDDGTWFNFRTRSTFSLHELAQHYKNHRPTMGGI